MVLFCTKLLLRGKSNLSKVWLAAHWEKKLKKCQICQIDIERSVKDMLAREIILDLRLSGHLLIGIVKIFSRKTLYLLNECNDIFSRVRVFQTTLIELPARKLQAPVHKITLPEMIGCLDELEFARLDDGFELNQSRLEEITLKELNGNERLIDEEDDFNLFNEEDGLLNFDENIDMLSLFTDNVEENDLKANHLNGQADPIINNSPLHSPPSNENEEPVVNDFIEEYEQRLAHASHCQELIDINCVFKCRSVLTLEILSGSLKKPLRIKKGKRKLIVDEEKKLKKEELDKQIYDTSDITFPMDLAPPSKWLMTLKGIGSSEQLLQLPGQKMPNLKMLHCFKRNLRIQKTEERESSEDESGIVIEIPRRSSPSEITTTPTRISDRDEEDPLLPHTNESSDEDLSNAENTLAPPAFDDLASEEEMNRDGEVTETCEEPILNLPGQLMHDLTSTQESSCTPGLLQDRIIELVRDIRTMLRKDEEIKFSNLVKHDKRRRVARKFLSILMLKKFEVVELKQKHAYGEITILPGRNFADTCMTI